MWIDFRGENVMFVNQFKKRLMRNGEHFEGGEMIALKSPNFCKQMF